MNAMMTNNPNSSTAQPSNGQIDGCNGVTDGAKNVAFEKAHNPLKNNDCSGVTLPEGDMVKAGAIFEPAILRELLTTMTKIIERYMVLPHLAAETAALWIVHTYTL